MRYSTGDSVPPAKPLMLVQTLHHLQLQYVLLIENLDDKSVKKKKIDIRQDDSAMEYCSETRACGIYS